MSYGNVLSVFDSDEQIITCVEDELAKLKSTAYERIESTFFIETEDRDAIRALLEVLKSSGDQIQFGTSHHQNRCICEV